MIEQMSAVRIANAIMLDSSFQGHYLIVEGSKDSKLYGKFVNTDGEVRIKEAWGCNNVKEVLNILESREFDKKIGIVDSDFSVILNESLKTNNLFVTDYHDIEVMMFKSTALNTVLGTLGDTEKIKDFSQTTPIDSIILNLAAKIGLLKLTNKIYNLGLVFKPKRLDSKPLKYKDFISEKNLTFISDDMMIKTVFNYSLNRGTDLSDINEIKEKFNLVTKKAYQIEHLVNGHDLSNIIFLLLKRVIRSNNAILKDFNCIEDSLIMAYEARDFIKTQIFYELSKWANDKDVNLFREDITILYSHMVEKMAL
ncbi:DUF4435 domain-containing protein [Bacillus mycoides]|uniref:DUF4435 domain-containing protein n=1 Tax=Bacillus mycoides TaxID=1405 RepID=UPI00292F2DA4|nr:DUF4435 domain-containing protein [Bacillus mycoides]WOA60673.1 DUF4435 domain-containing protein [Bacillus mycoides]